MAIRLTTNHPQGITISANMSRKPFEEFTGKIAQETVGNWGRNGDQGVHYLTGVITSYSIHYTKLYESAENVARAEEIKAAIVSYLDESGLAYATTSLTSETYNNQWSVLTSDVNTMCTMYVMGEITEADWTDFSYNFV